MAPDAFTAGADEQRRRMQDVLDVEAGTLRRTAGLVGVMADDAATWTEVAGQLEQAQAFTDSDRDRRALRRAAFKARHLAATAASIRRDMDKLRSS